MDDAIDRRTLLGLLGSAGTVALAGCSLLDREPDADTETLSGDRARRLAERFAPTLYFDVDERWYPTDPRPYTVERDGQTVVDGFRALNDYTRAFRESSDPPNPTVFYHVVAYADSPLAVVQYWFYSAFDQFTTNFHWHDWEALHVFVDTDTGDPQLHVASSHARSVPNNEFLDPDPDAVPHVLAELGSHSSALSVNDDRDSFQRLPAGDLLADITNSPVDGIAALAQIPLAYGLPRGEGYRLPFVRPELDDAPLVDHPDLPDVTTDDLLPDALTVASFDALASPPTELPERATGTVFAPVGGEDEDVAYDLVPTEEVEDIAAFTGPQLSFEFAVPQFAEDAIAGHLTTTGAPWTQDRYTNPAADITDANHRRTLAERYDAIADTGPVNTVVATISDVLGDADAPDGAGVTTETPTVEGVVLLESDPTAVPTSNGVAVAHDVPAGDHRFTVNRAGTAPHSETLAVHEGADATPIPAGVDGEIPLVANEAATKLEVDADGTDADLTRLAVEDDFGGRLYDAPIDGPDAVYVHRDGAYTAEVRDADDAVGAHRVNPDPAADRVRVDRPDTGKAALATFLADVATESRADVETIDGDGGQSNAIQGLATALGAVGDAAQRAADRASAGERGRADDALDTVRSRLDTVAARLEDARSALPAEWYRATGHRLDQATRRVEQARASDRL